MYSPLAFGFVLIAAAPTAAMAPDSSTTTAATSLVPILAMQSARRPQRAAPRVRPVRPVRPRERAQPPRINTGRIRNAIANGATPARVRKKIQDHHGQ